MTGGRADDSGRFPQMYPPAPERNPWDEPTQPTGPYGQIHKLGERVSRVSDFAKHARGAIWVACGVAVVIVSALGFLVVRAEETRDTARNAAVEAKVLTEQVREHVETPGHSRGRDDISALKEEIGIIKSQLQSATSTMERLADEIQQERREHRRLRRQRR